MGQSSLTPLVRYGPNVMGLRSPARVRPPSLRTRANLLESPRRPGPRPGTGVVSEAGSTAPRPRLGKHADPGLPPRRREGAENSWASTPRPPPLSAQPTVFAKSPNAPRARDAGVSSPWSLGEVEAAEGPWSAGAPRVPSRTPPCGLESRPSRRLCPLAGLQLGGGHPRAPLSLPGPHPRPPVSPLLGGRLQNISALAGPWEVCKAQGRESLRGSSPPASLTFFSGGVCWV